MKTAEEILKKHVDPDTRAKYDFAILAAMEEYAKQETERLQIMVCQHQNLKNQYKEQIENLEKSVAYWEQEYKDLKAHLRAVIASYERD